MVHPFPAFHQDFAFLASDPADCYALHEAPVTTSEQLWVAVEFSLVALIEEALLSTDWMAKVA